MQRTLDTIVELQKAQSELEEAERLYHGVPDSMVELKSSYDELKEKLEGLATTVSEADQRRRAAESEAEAKQDKVTQYQEQISRVTTQREYGALLSEIDTVNSQIKDLEDAALQELELHDTSKTEKDALQSEFSEIEAQYDGEMASWEQQRPEVLERVEKLKGTVEVLQERLDPATLAKYQRLYERHSGSPLAAITLLSGNGANKLRHCSACNYRVRPQVVVQIQSQGALETCDSCHRILFLEPEEG